jgi:hypothetical protein
MSGKFNQFEYRLCKFGSDGLISPVLICAFKNGMFVTLTAYKGEDYSENDL